MNVRKIFCPDLMFNDYVKASWCDNIETIEKKIPIQKELKQKEVYALDIKPLSEKDWFAFALPVKKDWIEDSFEKMKSPVLSFDIVGCNSFKLNVEMGLEDDIQKETINIDDTENWNNIKLSINIKRTKLITFSGSVNQIANLLMKDIKIINGV